MNKITTLSHFREKKSEKTLKKLNENITQVTEEVMYDIDFSVAQTIKFLEKEKGLSHAQAYTMVMTHLGKLVHEHCKQGGKYV